MLVPVTNLTPAIGKSSPLIKGGMYGMTSAVPVSVESNSVSVPVAINKFPVQTSAYSNTILALSAVGGFKSFGITVPVPPQ